MLVYLRDGSAQTILHAATLRQKLYIKLSILPSHSILTPGRPVPVLTLQCQAPGKATAEAPFLSHWYDSTRKILSQAGFEPRIFRSRGGCLNHYASKAVRKKISQLLNLYMNTKYSNLKKEILLSIHSPAVTNLLKTENP